MQVSGRRIFFDGLAFFGRNIGGVVLAALMPAILSIAAQLYGQSLQTEEMIRFMTAVRNQQAVTPNFVLPIMVTIVPVMIAGAWQFVRVARFRLRRDFETASGELSATLWSLLYLLGVTLLVVIPAIFIAILGEFAIAAVTGMSFSLAQGQDFSKNPAGLVLFILLMLIVAVAIFYVCIRFWAGMPAVALGQKPSLFRTIWPLGRPVAWSLLGWLLLLGVAAGLIFGGLNFLLVSDAFFDSSNPQEMINRIAENPDAFRHEQFTNMLFSAVEGVFLSMIVSIIFAEAYAQLTQASTGAGSV